jgi:hypothetical protein
MIWKRCVTQSEGVAFGIISSSGCRRHSRLTVMALAKTRRKRGEPPLTYHVSPLTSHCEAISVPSLTATQGDSLKEEPLKTEEHQNHR